MVRNKRARAIASTKGACVSDVSNGQQKRLIETASDENKQSSGRNYRAGQVKEELVKVDGVRRSKQINCIPVSERRARTLKATRLGPNTTAVETRERACVGAGKKTTAKVRRVGKNTTKAHRKTSGQTLMRQTRRCEADEGEKTVQKGRLDPAATPEPRNGSRHCRKVIPSEQENKGVEE